jgi:alkylation response protein AidB-like acyl-CoA dehydrogenase
MIGFDLTQEQKDLRDMVHEFARDVVRPAAAEYDEHEETPWPVMQQAHQLGIDTYSYPEEFGGGGVSDMVTERRSSRLARASARARWASPARRTSTHWITRYSGGRSGSRLRAIRRSPSSWPTWPLRSKLCDC